MSNDDLDYKAVKMDSNIAEQLDRMFLSQIKTNGVASVVHTWSAILASKMLEYSIPMVAIAPPVKAETDQPFSETQMPAIAYISKLIPMTELQRDMELHTSIIHATLKRLSEANDSGKLEDISEELVLLAQAYIGDGECDCPNCRANRNEEVNDMAADIGVVQGNA